MVWFCATGCTKIRENSVPETFKKARMTTDYRKADPTYVNFRPTTAEDAINKFYRHKNLGVPPHLWPEVFVDCAANLPDEELQKFQDWLVNPGGDPTGPMLKGVDRENEALRLQLLKEATARDVALNVVHEEREPPVESLQEVTVVIDENYMDVDDEKVQDDDPSSMMVNMSVQDEFEMVTSSER